MINENVLRGKWTEIKGEFQRTWGNITNDEWETAQGDAKKLSGLIQKKYGVAQEEAESKMSDIVSRFGNGDKPGWEDTNTYKH